MADCNKERVIEDLFRMMKGKGYRCERWVPDIIKCYKDGIQVVFFVLCRKR